MLLPLQTLSPSGFSTTSVHQVVCVVSETLPGTNKDLSPSKAWVENAKKHTQQILEKAGHHRKTEQESKLVFQGAVVKKPEHKPYLVSEYGGSSIGGPDLACHRRRRRSLLLPAGDDPEASAHSSYCVFSPRLHNAATVCPSGPAGRPTCRDTRVSVSQSVVSQQVPLTLLFFCLHFIGQPAFALLET